MFLFWLCNTPKVRSHFPFTIHQVSAPYIRVATLASKPSLPVAPYPKRSFRSFAHLEFFRKFSSEMRHATESPGKLPHRFPSANFGTPSPPQRGGQDITIFESVVHPSEKGNQLYAGGFP